MVSTCDLKKRKTNKTTCEQRKYAYGVSSIKFSFFFRLEKLSIEEKK